MDLHSCYCFRSVSPRVVILERERPLKVLMLQNQLVTSQGNCIVRKSNLLLSCYSKSKPLDQTLRLFHLLPDRDTVTWNTILSACARHGHFACSLWLFQWMLRSGCHPPDALTFRAALKACIAIDDFELAIQIHAYIIKVQEFFWCHSDLVINTALMGLYIKFGAIDVAHQMFDRMPERDVVVFTALMIGYSDMGEYGETLRIFRDMVGGGSLMANEFAFSCVLRACSGLSSAFEGKQVHAQIVKSSFQSDVFVGTALVHLYAKCEMMGCAETAFFDISEPSVASWNALMAGNVGGDEALRFFSQMRVSDVSPDCVTFGSLLRSCKDLGLCLGRQIQGLAVKMLNAEIDVFVGGALFELYLNWGCTEDALKVFDEIRNPDIAAFNSAIQVFVRNGHGAEAIRMFHEALQRGKEPNEATLMGLLVGIRDLKQGKQLHSLITKLGFCLRGTACASIASSLIKMYSSFHSLDNAFKLFDRTHCPDMILWTSIISGFLHSGESQQAMKLYNLMLSSGPAEPPNHFTFSSLLRACADLAAAEEGKQVHAQIIKSSLEMKSDLFIASGLVDMYAKCGFIADARKLFDKMPVRDLVSWNAMIAGLAQHGLAEAAIETFEELLNQPNIEPNKVSFVGVLTACSHKGLLEQGYRYFRLIDRPTIEHYACLVDMVGRAGKLEEARNIIEQMPYQPNEVIWSALLGACRVHGNIELGEQSAKHLLELNPKDPGTYVALSNIYATAGRWDDVKKIRKLMKDRGVNKDPGVSWLKINRSCHAFFAEFRHRRCILQKE